MAHVTHQTVRLASGRHVSPVHGVCVLELAAMLAGEQFTDHPRSVSNVIGTFMRGYNDMIDDRRRQDLYEYAAKVLGTAAGSSTEFARAQLLCAWGDNIRSDRLLGRLRRRLSRPSVRLDPILPEPAAIYALRGIRKVTDEKHRAVLELVDMLIDLGSPLLDRPADDQRRRDGDQDARARPDLPPRRRLSIRAAVPPGGEDRGDRAGGEERADGSRRPQ
jgi:hypothetical protein